MSYVLKRVKRYNAFPTDRSNKNSVKMKVYTHTSAVSKATKPLRAAHRPPPSQSRALHSLILKPVPLPCSRTRAPQYTSRLICSFEERGEQKVVDPVDPEGDWRSQVVGREKPVDRRRHVDEDVVDRIFGQRGNPV
jgi:hypothetical protein